MDDLRSFVSPDTADGGLDRRSFGELAAKGPAFALDRDLMAAAVESRGLAMVETSVAEAELRAGRLALALEPAWPEDFAYYQEQIPGAFLFLGNFDESKGIVHFCHHPRFRVDDTAMEHGVHTWLALALGSKSG